MANYPYVSPADENAQYLTSILSQYKPGTLGNTATIGNPQGQQDYASQLAQALAEMDSATKQQGRAEGMQGAKYIDNSGLLGVAAVLAQQFAGKKMDEKASKKYEDASMRAMTAKDVLDEAKAERAAARALKATQGEQAQRRKDGEAMGLTGRDLTRYALEGKMGEGVRMNTVQGDDGYMYNVDPYNSTSQRVQVGGGQTQQHSQPSMPFDIKGDVPPEVAAAMQSDPAAWESGNSIDIKAPPTYLRGKGPDPLIAQRQAMADSRADESLGFQRSANQRAEEEAARKRNAPKAVTEDQSKSAGYALRMERALGSIAKSSKENPGANRPGVGTALLDILPDAVGNQIKSPERQNIEAAQLDALDAALTLNTGAAYTKEQLFGLRKSYFPQPGDAEQTIKDKEGRLKGLIETARIRARSAYPDGGGSAAAPQGNAAQPGHVPMYNPKTGEFE